MLSTVGKGPQQPPADVIDRLLACHGRIRRLGKLAQRLAEARGAPLAEVQEAAQSLRAYFVHALPLHAADEDLSIRPRLHEVELPQEVRNAIEQMSEQHNRIDEQIAALVVAWDALASDPSSIASMPDDFARASKSLHELLELHLAMEEETIFPAMRRYLLPGAEGVIAREMRERRGHVHAEADEV